MDHFYAKFVKISKIIKFRSNLSNHLEIYNILKGKAKSYFSTFRTQFNTLGLKPKVKKRRRMKTRGEFISFVGTNQTLNIQNCDKNLTIYLTNITKSCPSFTNTPAFYCFNQTESHSRRNH